MMSLMSRQVLRKVLEVPQRGLVSSASSLHHRRRPVKSVTSAKSFDQLQKSSVGIKITKAGKMLELIEATQTRAHLELLTKHYIRCLKAQESFHVKVFRDVVVKHLSLDCVEYVSELLFGDRRDQCALFRSSVGYRVFFLHVLEHSSYSQAQLSEMLQTTYEMGYLSANTVKNVVEFCVRESYEHCTFDVVIQVLTLGTKANTVSPHVLKFVQTTYGLSSEELLAKIS